MHTSVSIVFIHSIRLMVVMTHSFCKIHTFWNFSAFFLVYTLFFISCRKKSSCWLSHGATTISYYVNYGYVRYRRGEESGSYHACAEEAATKLGRAKNAPCFFVHI